MPSKRPLKRVISALLKVILFSTLVLPLSHYTTAFQDTQRSTQEKPAAETQVSSKDSGSAQSTSSSSSASSGHHFNISQDILADTELSEDGFLFAEWTCLDEFLTIWEDNPRELEHLWSRIWLPPSSATSISSGFSNCRCFFNARCAPSLVTGGNGGQQATGSAAAVAQLWLRCYDLESDQALSNFTKALNSTSFLRNQTNNKLEACSQHSESGASLKVLRFDLVHVLKPSIVHSAIDLISQLAAHSSTNNVHLESLTIRNSSLEELAPRALVNLVHLKSLNLTSNRLVSFHAAEVLPLESSTQQLVSLDLSHNRLVTVNLSSLQSLARLDLSSNSLSTLHQSDLSTGVIDLLTSLQRPQQPAQQQQQQRGGAPSLPLKFSNNPWRCDHHLEWLVSAIAAIVEANGHLFSNVHGLELAQTDEPECNHPPEATLFPFSVWQSIRVTEICKKCDCFLEPKYAKNGYRYVIVNCTDKSLRAMPERLPKNAKVIDLSNNQIRRLNSGRVKLSHWEHVNKIILQNNSLETLDGLDQIHSNWTIVYLDISGNLLTEIPYHILDREKVLSSRIDKILIGNNPYSCDCNTVKMQKWLQSNYRIIHDLANVRCGFVREELMRVNESSGQQLQQQQQQQQPQPQQLQQAIASRQGQLYNREILKINNLELCPSIASVEIFDIVNGILAFGIVFLLAKVTYDYFWQKRTGNLPQFWKVNY